MAWQLAVPLGEFTAEEIARMRAILDRAERRRDAE